MSGVLTSSVLGNIFKSSKGFNKVLDKVKVTAIQDGTCKAEVTISEEHTNPMGGLHGGFSATLVDIISTCALMSHKYGGTPNVSVDMHMTYLKGATIGDELEINADTLRVGKNVAFLEVSIKNKSTGELLVKGTHTKFLLQNKK